MHFTVYKITNKTNKKFYIGAHKTSNLNDEYMGSGKLITRAIKKYGLENFEKEILYVFESEQDMFSKEKELITEMKPPYNLHEGGNGGFEYINKNGLNWSYEKNNRITPFRTLKFNENRSEWSKKSGLKGGPITLERKIGIHSDKFKEKIKIFGGTFKNKKHTIESKIKISKGNKGKNLGNNNPMTCEENKKKLSFKIKELIKNGKFKPNPPPLQKDTIWINNTKINKRIKNHEFEKYYQNGWVKGRLIK